LPIIDNKTSDILGSTETGRSYVEDWVMPKCQKCNVGQLVPLSDYGGQGAAVHYKAWVCINPTCGFNIKIRNGDIYLNEPITPGSMNIPRAR
jgi:hypothetical protein